MEPLKQIGLLERERIAEPSQRSLIEVLHHIDFNTLELI